MANKPGLTCQAGLAAEEKAGAAPAGPLSGLGTASGTARVTSGDKSHLISGRKKQGANEAAVSNPNKPQFEQPEPSSASRALQKA